MRAAIHQENLIEQQKEADRRKQFLEGAPGDPVPSK